MKKLIYSNYHLILTILLVTPLIIVGTQIYFRHDDSQLLLWAIEFDKSIWDIFSPDPLVNNTAHYGGMQLYYRPFLNLYVYLMVTIFGISAFYFQLVGGLLVLGSMIFMFKITESYSNKNAAFISVLCYFLIFHMCMTSFYHVGYPFIFFFQLGCFYYCSRGLKQSSNKDLIVAFIFLIFATTKQTTPFLMFSVILAYFIGNWKGTFLGSIRKALLPVLFLSPALSLYLNEAVSKSTILVSEQFEYVEYLRERIYFYGELFSSGYAGIYILSIIFIFLMILLIEKKRTSHRGSLKVVAGIVLFSVIISYAIVQTGHASIYIVMVLLMACFVIEKSSRTPLAWFFASLAMFSTVNYYHVGYFLEAAYGLCIAMSLLLHQILYKLNTTFRKEPYLKLDTKLLVSFGIGLTLLLGSLTWKISGQDYLRQFKTISYFISTNRNFMDLVEYLTLNLPVNAVVYELSEKSLGTDMNRSRFFNLEEKTLNKKVMNIAHKRSMLKVLSRDDIVLIPASHIPKKTDGRDKYFIALNKHEIEIAKRQFQLKLIKSFTRKETEAAVFKLQ